MKQTYLCNNCEHRAESRIKDYCNNPESPNYLKAPIPNQTACGYTEQKDQDSPSVVELMKHNICAYNKYITCRDLRKKTPLELLQLVHESERRGFAITLTKLGICLTSDVQIYLK